MPERLSNLRNIEDLGFSLTGFKVTPSAVKARALDVFWTIEKTDLSATFVPRFNLCISENHSGPWLKVLEEPVEAGPVLGVGHKLYSHRPGRFVRLVMVDESGDPVYATDPMDPTHQMNRQDYLEYREQLRLESLALQKKTGTPGYLFKKIITECSCECSDEILGGAFDSQCPLCYGTGKVGGYHPPYRMMIDWASSTKGTGNQTEQQQGISEVVRRQIKVMPFPELATKDIIADPVSRTFHEVVKVDPVLFKTFPTARIAVLSLLPKTDPVYKLAVPTE